MSTAMPSDLHASTRFLAEPAMRRSLEDFVRRRVPASDVEDVVQTVLVEALAAEGRPQDEGELRRWLLGIARHKVVDHHRRASRERAAEIPDLPVGPPPVEARALAQWAEKQAGASRDAKITLEWMAREGEGEKLESIAAEEKIAAATVRQRVSRMRRWMKERWLAELAAAAALAALALLLWRLFHKDEPIAVPEPRPEPSTISPEAPPLDRARALREKAFEDCDRAAWRACLDELDEAKKLDPAGDTDPKVGAARAKANDALNGPVLQKDAPPVQPSAPVQQKNAPVPVPTSGPVQKSAPAPVQSSVPVKKPTFEKTPPKPSPKKDFSDQKDAEMQQLLDRKKASKMKK
jgi:DNA-directed RNA polymerase specialized sigma24 family protein